MAYPWRPRRYRYTSNENVTANFHVGRFPESLLVEIEQVGKANKCKCFRESLEMVVKKGLERFAVAGFREY